MESFILLSVIVISSANIMQYPGLNVYNSPDYNYPSYTLEQPVAYSYQNNYVNQPQARQQYHSNCNSQPLSSPSCYKSNEPICATYNGIWKTFANLYQFRNELNQGQAWNFHSYGTCPKPEKPMPETLEPICATYNNRLRTFTNTIALEVEKLITGRNWVKLFTGVCPHVPEVATTTQAPLVTTPNPNQPVCGVLNGVWRTFPNLTDFNAQVALGLGWTFYSFGFCPRPEVCARFENEFRTFSSTLAMEVDKVVTGRNWIVIAAGACPNIPTTTTTPTATPSPTTSTTTTPATTTTTTTTTSATGTEQPFTLGTTSTTTRRTTRYPTNNGTIHRYSSSTATPPFDLDDEAFTVTTLDGCNASQRIQKNNNYNGPYVEGSFHYNHNTFNQANIKPYRKNY